MEEELQLAVEIVQNADASKIIVRKYEGRDHLVVPSVMVKEGVLNERLVPAAEIQKFHAAWNGTPVVLRHPNDGARPISANAPSVLEKTCLGRVFSTMFANNSLKSELWIDIEKCKTLGGDALTVYERLSKGLPVEGSTAFFCDVEPKIGVFNEKAYSEICHNLRPDHYALLPDEKGACSWKDGCGAPRVHSESGLVDIIVNTLRKVGVIKEKRSMKTKVELIAALVACTASGFTKADEPFLATRTDEQLAQLATNAGLDCGCEDAKAKAAKEKADAKAKTDAEALAANAAQKKDDESGTQKKDDAPLTFEDQLAAMPDSPLKGQMLSMLAANKAAKDGVIAAIVANAANKLTKEQLEGMDITVLHSLHETLNPGGGSANGSTGPVINYAGRGFVKPAANKGKSDDELPIPSVVTNAELFKSAKSA